MLEYKYYENSLLHKQQTRHTANSRKLHALVQQLLFTYLPKQATISIVTMSSGDYWPIFYLFACRMYYGKNVNLYMRNSGWYFLQRQPRPFTCNHCQKILTRKQITIDHIIPQCIIKDLTLLNLLFDDRNLQILCHTCNQIKGDNIDHLPKSVVDKLQELGYNPT